MDKKLLSIKDIFLLAALLAAALLAFFVSGRNRSTGKVLVVTVEGKEILREELTSEKKIRFETADGGYNILSIEQYGDGEYSVRCSESNCPEKVCMEKGAVVLTDDPIVCLPHRLTAKLIGNK